LDAYNTYRSEFQDDACLYEHRKRKICREIWSSKPGTVTGWCFGWTVTERGRTLLTR